LVFEGVALDFGSRAVGDVVSKEFDIGSVHVEGLDLRVWDFDGVCGSLDVNHAGNDAVTFDQVTGTSLNVDFELSVGCSGSKGNLGVGSLDRDASSGSGGRLGDLGAFGMLSSSGKTDEEGRSKFEHNNIF